MVPLTQTDQAACSAAAPVSRSLEGLNATVPVPAAGQGFWRHWRAYTGPAFLVSVGYMDPGNWGTDLQGGAEFRYGLLWVVALSSFREALNRGATECMEKWRTTPSGLARRVAQLIGEPVGA